MNKDLVLQNRILEFRTGSHLYGTNTHKSDEDYVGVFMPTEEFIFGFQRVENVDLSIKSKSENGKNTFDAKDVVYHEFRKFIKLALDNNPNILELLFANKDNILFMNDVGMELISMRHAFPHMGLVNRFKKYAESQKHKMVIRSDNYFVLQGALKYLNELLKEPENGDRLIVELESLPFFQKSGRYIMCGDLNFQKHVSIKKVQRMIHERVAKFGNRKELVSKHGYDTKFASHLIRLLYECEEFVLTGSITFPLQKANLILDIRKGKYKIKDVIDMSNDICSSINSICETTDLPPKPNTKLIQQFTIDNMRRFYGES